MHVFGIVVWLGGLMFQSAVAAPIIQFEGELAKAAMRKVHKRFVAFVWMSAWTMLITGVLLMLLNPRFVWFRYQDRWSVLLASKQLIFVLMMFYAFGYARMLKYLETPSSNGGFNEKAELYRRRLDQFRKISIVLGIAALLLAAAMQVYG
ncbi:MAG: hypothetical protein HY033_05920 [Ignavibacteriae bacterium]|nr:hypothetical protein [Ignavibacteria bacterium]MBI3364428.1 hypothetical protein [Ignavibacteriota bacterium]